MAKFEQHYLRRMNTKASDLRMPNEDLRLIINAEYEKTGELRKVKGYEQVGDQMTAIEATIFDSEADWNQGTLSNTESLVNRLVLTGGIIDQDLYNDSHDVYAGNWIAQSFEASSTSVTKVALYLDKILGSSLSLYDDFGDSSIDSAKWTTAGTVSETGGELVLTYVAGGAGLTSGANTDNKASGDPIKGAQWYMKAPDGTTAGSHQVSCEITDNTNFIRYEFLVDVGDLQLQWSGTYGTGTKRLSSVTSGTMEIKENNGNVELYVSGVLQQTLSGVSVAANSYFKVTANKSSGDLTGTRRLYVKDAYFYQTVTALTDLDIRIETDNTGSPSGSAVSNGTTTIDDNTVQAGIVSLTESSFSTAPSLAVGTTYWLVVKQTGGDANNKYRIYKQNSNVYSDGTTAVSTNAGVAWAADSDAPSDLAFRVYGAYSSSGTWISPNIMLESGQTLSQLVLVYADVSVSNAIDRIDIVNTSDAVQSSYTTDITSGASITLRTSDFTSGFTFTNGNTFRVKVTLKSGGTVTPAVISLSVDSPERKILHLSPYYKSDGSKSLMALIAGSLFRFVSSTWAAIFTGFTSGQETDTTTFRASKGPKIASGDVVSATSTSFTAVLTPEPSPNYYQGKFVKIVTGPGAGQVRVIQSNTGTSTSTSTTTSTSTSTTTSTTTSSTTSTSTSIT